MLGYDEIHNFSHNHDECIELAEQILRAFPEHQRRGGSSIQDMHFFKAFALERFEFFSSMVVENLSKGIVIADMPNFFGLCQNSIACKLSIIKSLCCDCIQSCFTPSGEFVDYGVFIVLHRRDKISQFKNSGITIITKRKTVDLRRIESSFLRNGPSKERIKKVFRVFN